MPNRAQSSGVDPQQFGRLIEAMEDSKADRAQLRLDLKDAMTTLGNSVRGLEQTSQSTANQVSMLVTQKLDARMAAIEKAINTYDGHLKRYDHEDCDRRITVIEEDMRYYKRIVGTGFGAVARVIGFVLGSATVGAFVQQLFLHWLTGR